MKKKSYNQRWYLDIKKINENDFDLYISDNLPEIVHFSNKCILMANFLA